jgi:hypothetical protein
MTNGYYDLGGRHWTQTSSPMGQWSAMVVDNRGKVLTAIQNKGGCFVSPPSSSMEPQIVSDGEWITTSAPGGAWQSVAADSTGQYLIAVQLRDSQYNPGFIYSSSSGYLYTHRYHHHFV